MDICKYDGVKTRDDNDERNKASWKPFFRQILVASGIWTVYFTAGLLQGTPTVYVPQVRREANSTDAVSVEMASWLSSIIGYATVPWILVLSYLIDRVGRKKTFTLASVVMIAVFIGFYLSSSPAILLLFEALEGLPHAAAFTVNVISLVEYTSPKYRGVLLTMKSASIHWGIWAANAIGTYAHWKYIAVLGFVSSLYSLTVFFWPESPYWLAERGRFDECRKAFRWVRGRDSASEKELVDLIESHRGKKDSDDIGDDLATSDDTAKPSKSTKATFRFIVESAFYKPMLVSTGTLLMHILSGKQICAIYAIDILKHITRSEKSAYNAMLILDGVSVFSMYVGCILSKFLKRRTMLFSFGCSSVAFLLSLSLYLYLCHLSLLTKDNYISVSLLVGFSICIGMGPLILATSLYGELIPSDYKKESVIIIPMTYLILQSTLLKTAPYLFKAFDMHGTFLFYSITESICLIVMYKYLPETKDKTLQEINEYFKGGKRSSKNVSPKDGDVRLLSKD